MDYIMKNLHFIFTHVPIALLIFSFVFDVAALIFRKKEWHSAGMLCLVVGALWRDRWRVDGADVTEYAGELA